MFAFRLFSRSVMKMMPAITMTPTIPKIIPVIIGRVSCEGVAVEEADGEIVVLDEELEGDDIAYNKYGF